jgi:hypothetical protein
LIYWLKHRSSRPGMENEPNVHIFFTWGSLDDSAVVARKQW